MFTRATWIALGAATVSAVVSAVGANMALERYLDVPASESNDAPVGVPDGPATVADRVRPPRARSEQQYISSILGRNLFDSESIGVEAPPTTGPGGGPTESTLDVVLRGTMVAEPVQYSTALIAEDESSSASGYSVGDMVKTARILEIQEGRVKILNKGTEEWLIMGQETEGPKRSVSREPTKTDEGEESDWIEKTGDDEYTVQRSKIDEIINDPASLSRMGRALLHRGRDGEFDGYRLSAIRRGSIPDQLGIRNGDIIHAVNGMPLNSVQGAMQAFQSLQSEGALKFEVTRRGQPVNLSYEIQ